MKKKEENITIDFLQLICVDSIVNKQKTVVNDISVTKKKCVARANLLGKFYDCISLHHQYVLCKYDISQQIAILQIYKVSAAKELSHIYISGFKQASSIRFPSTKEWHLIYSAKIQFLFVVVLLGMSARRYVQFYATKHTHTCMHTYTRTHTHAHIHTQTKTKTLMNNNNNNATNGEQ